MFGASCKTGYRGEAERFLRGAGRALKGELRRRQGPVERGWKVDAVNALFASGRSCAESGQVPRRVPPSLTQSPRVKGGKATNSGLADILRLDLLRVLS